jgi:hypothetical protein
VQFPQASDQALNSRQHNSPDGAKEDGQENGAPTIRANGAREESLRKKNVSATT